MVSGTGTINALSFAPLFVEAVMLGRGDDPQVQRFPATAFLVGHPHDLMVVTARHVVAGENLQGTIIDASGARPDELHVHLHDALAGDPKARTTIKISLWNDEFWDEPLFYSHPMGSAVDVAVVRLGHTPGPEHFVPLDPWRRSILGDLWDAANGPAPADFESDQEIPLRPLDRVSILGFPFGDEGTWPTGVWVTGFVASQPTVPYMGGPGFLLDARTRPGLSGAPVVRYIRPGDPVTSIDGVVYEHDVHHVELLGVYSGRLDPQSDLGRCVTNDALREVIDSTPEATYFDAPFESVKADAAVDE